MASDFETVYTVTNYYDGVRAGIADFNGVPHYYECAFDEEKDDWAEYFLLKGIDEETFQLAMEDWEIWKRWYAAWQSDKKSVETHSALPEDHKRHIEITEVLAKRLLVTPSQVIKAQGKFERDHSDIHPKNATNPWAELRVKWQVIS